jgi:hypothetical protein
MQVYDLTDSYDNKLVSATMASLVTGYQTVKHVAGGPLDTRLVTQ